MIKTLSFIMQQQDARQGQIFIRGCECRKGCRKGEPMTQCLNFIAQSGSVFNSYCVTCEAITWHHSGDCLECRRMAQRALDYELKFLAA